MPDDIEEIGSPKASEDEMLSDEQRSTFVKEDLDEQETDNPAKNISNLFMSYEKSLELDDEAKNNLAVQWSRTKEYLETQIEGDDRLTALGFLMGAPSTEKVLLSPDDFKLKGQEFYARKYEVYKDNFPELIPNDLVEYVKKDLYSPGGSAPAGSLRYGSLDYKFAEKCIEEILNGRSKSETVIDIRQKKLPSLFHGFNINDLNKILDSGITAHRSLESGRQMRESAFPMFVSFTRPPQYSREDNAYEDTYTFLSDYGATARFGKSNGKLTVIPKLDYILSRSFSAGNLDYKGFLTTPDEYESTVGVIPPEQIDGIICNFRSFSYDDVKDEMLGIINYEPSPQMISEKDSVIEAIKNSGRDIKVFGVDGTLLYPEFKKPSEVAALFEESVKDLEEE